MQSLLLLWTNFCGVFSIKKHCLGGNSEVHTLRHNLRFTLYFIDLVLSFSLPFLHWPPVFCAISILFLASSFIMCRICWAAQQSFGYNIHLFICNSPLCVGITSMDTEGITCPGIHRGSSIPCDSREFFFSVLLVFQFTYLPAFYLLT